MKKTLTCALVLWASLTCSAQTTPSTPLVSDARSAAPSVEKDNIPMTPSAGTANSTNTANSGDKIEVLRSVRQDNYIVEKISDALGRKIINYDEMAMKINDKTYHCWGGGGMHPLHAHKPVIVNAVMSLGMP